MTQSFIFLQCFFLARNNRILSELIMYATIKYFMKIFHERLWIGEMNK